MSRFVDGAILDPRLPILAYEILAQIITMLYLMEAVMDAGTAESKHS